MISCKTKYVTQWQHHKADELKYGQSHGTHKNTVNGDHWCQMLHELLIIIWDESAKEDYVNYLVISFGLQFRKVFAVMCVA